MLHWSQEAFVSGLGFSLLHSLWQGALLGVVGLALQKRLKDSAPELRCGVFSLLQLTFFTVWLGTFLCLYLQACHPLGSEASLLSGAISVGHTTLISFAGERPGLTHLLPALVPFLVTVWAVGVCALSLRHLGGVLLLYRLSRVGTVECPPVWEACAERLATQMGIGRKIIVRCSTQIDVPCAFGLFKSYILLPASAAMGLTPDQTQALIAHELAHIARHDLFFNLVQVCMETILFYHPVVWWLSVQIREAREQRCDDLAIQIIGDRALYARALYALEEARATIPQLALGAKGDQSKMTNRHLIHRIQRVLGVSGPEKRDPWAKGALALCAAAIGVATLMPIHAYSRPAQQDGATKQVKTVTVSTKIILNINGDQIELNTTDLTPDTLVKVNGKEGRFGDLNATQQQQLQEAVKAVHVKGGPEDVKVIVRKGDNSDGATYSKVIVSKGITSIGLNINGDQIELNTTDLKPDTLVKVNGKEGRFGDLTPKQQGQLRQATTGIQHNMTIHVQKDGDPNSPVQSKVRVFSSVTHIALNINGDQIELNTTDLKPDTLVKVNGKEGRFGDLNATQQQQLQEAVKTVHVAGGPGSVNVTNGAKSRVIVHVNGDKVQSVSSGGGAKILLDINGDKVELTADSNDFSTKDLTPDSRVKVNGKEGRFGDLSERQQQLIRATNASIHVIISQDTPDGVGVIPGGGKQDVIVKVKKDLPPPTPPDKP